MKKLQSVKKILNWLQTSMWMLNNPVHLLFIRGWKTPKIHILLSDINTQNLTLSQCALICSDVLNLWIKVSLVIDVVMIWEFADSHILLLPLLLLVWSTWNENPTVFHLVLHFNTFIPIYLSQLLSHLPFIEQESTHSIQSISEAPLWILLGKSSPVLTSMESRK